MAMEAWPGGPHPGEIAAMQEAAMQEAAMQEAAEEASMLLLLLCQ